MSDGGPWTILEYTTDAGRSPVREFLESLKGRHEEEALALLGRLREAGNELRRPTSTALGGGLYELRGHQVRIFYMFRPGRRIVLLDGMIKNRDDIPPAVLRRLRAYQRDIESTRE